VHLRPRLIVFLAAISILQGLGADDADAGNPVALAQLALACPDGGRERTDAPPGGYARWCEESGPFGVPRHGPYATWHPSGATKEEGEYLDGWQHGRWTVWTAQGSKESEGEYRNGLKHGRWTTWERGGRTEGEYQYGLRQGVWTTWSNSGVTLEEGPYVYGRRQGLWTQWYPDGSKQEEAEFVADQRHGRFIRYAAGIKTFETTYRRNFPNGHVTMWHRNGQSLARPTSATHAPPAPSRRGISPVRRWAKAATPIKSPMGTSRSGIRRAVGAWCTGS